MRRKFGIYIFVLTIGLFLFVNRIYAVSCGGDNGVTSPSNFVKGVSLSDPDGSVIYAKTWCGPYFVNINKSSDTKKIDEQDVNKEVIYLNTDTKDVNLINSAYTGSDSNEYFKKNIGEYSSSSYSECPKYIKKDGTNYSSADSVSDADYFSAQDSVKVCSYDFLYLAFYKEKIGDYNFFRVYTNIYYNTRMGNYSEWENFDANKCPGIYKVQTDATFLYRSNNVSNVKGELQSINSGMLLGLQTFNIDGYRERFSKCNNYSNVEQQNQCKTQADNDFENSLRDYSTYCNQVYSSCNWNDIALEKCIETDKQITKLKKEFGIKGAECGVSSQLIKWLANIFKWVKYIAPVLAIILGMLDFIKSIASQSDDDMKKAQGKFVKRLIAAALLFIIPFIIEFVLDKFNIVSDNPFCNLI